MFWFTHYRFLFLDKCIDPRKRLVETLKQREFDRIECDISGEIVRLQHKQPRYFHNYWNSVFDGRFVIEGGKHYLLGYFRPSWRLLTLNMLGVFFSTCRLIMFLLDPALHFGSLTDLQMKELFWQVSFPSGLVILMLLGGLIGVPYQWKMLAAIRSSTEAAEA